MAGHNKWKQIKHKKEVTDKKRSEIFSKLLRAVSIAARTDRNPESNPVLRTAIERARNASVPIENIERAINKSSDAAERAEEIIIEAYGPEGVAILAHGFTDNTNRTVAEMKKIISDHGGKWAEPGSVEWIFEKTQEGERTPKFTQSPSDGASREKMNALRSALEDHPDIDTVYTNEKE